MSTVNSNDSISVCRMEHQILEHVKQALRVTLDWDAPSVSMPRKLSSLQFTLKSFQRHFERLMAIEEEGGYLSVVAEAKPNLQTCVDMLAKDHDRLRRRVREIVPYIEEIAEWQGDEFDSACIDIRSLLDDVDRHDEEEVTLLQDSLLYDEGGEG